MWCKFDLKCCWCSFQFLSLMPWLCTIPTVAVKRAVIQTRLIKPAITLLKHPHEASIGCIGTCLYLTACWISSKAERCNVKGNADLLYSCLNNQSFHCLFLHYEIGIDRHTRVIRVPLWESNDAFLVVLIDFFNLLLLWFESIGIV